MRVVPMGATGTGITAVQRILGVPESGEMDEATMEAIMAWMKKKGVPGAPTVATIKMIIEAGKPSDDMQEDMEVGESAGSPENMAEAAQQVVESNNTGVPTQKSAGEEIAKAMDLIKSKGPIYHFVGDSSRTPLWIVGTSPEGVEVEFPEREGESESMLMTTDELEKCDNPEKHYAEIQKSLEEGMAYEHRSCA